MEFKELLFKRRSVRSFKQRRLTEDEINYILTAAINAPSACNFQSWHFICVTDPETKERFKSICADWVSAAPAVFVICTDSEKIDERCQDKARSYKFAVQDTALAMQNMLLAAADIGLGGCIIGAYDQEKCVSELNIPEKYLPVALMPIGEPTAETPARSRKSIKEVTTFIGDSPDKADEPREKEPFELRHAWLPNAVFDDLGLPNSTFNNINLSSSKFTDINLSGSIFEDINFAESSFGGLNLSETKYQCVMLNNSEFKNVELKNASFVDCDFSGAAIDGINILDAIEKYKNNN